MSEATAEAETPKTPAPTTHKKTAGKAGQPAETAQVVPAGVPEPLQEDPVREGGDIVADKETSPESVTLPTIDLGSQQFQQIPQGPSVGRIVHYQLPGAGDEPLAAIITAVNDDSGRASLVIYREHLQFFRRNVPFSETQKAGHWSWPPRV